MRYDALRRPPVLDVADLRAALGTPAVSVAVDSEPSVLRYAWPCGCTAAGLGGPRCVASLCSAHAGKLSHLT
ncbi:MAG TPA: hypothetical protein VMF61_06175 [Candidatus Acidoferrales bacterium]|nr:hypothetical protein [Candidatus Acidoferrales bacterium]